jgi:hypothetical protein
VNQIKFITKKYLSLRADLWRSSLHLVDLRLRRYAYTPLRSLLIT